METQCCVLRPFQELRSEEIDGDSAYILFYEQQGVDYSQFLPKTDGKKMADTSSMDEDFESDYKKYCVLQWSRGRLPLPAAMFQIHPYDLPPQLTGQWPAYE